VTETTVSHLFHNLHTITYNTTTGKLQQAIAHYQEAIKIDPSFADAFSNLGEYCVIFFPVFAGSAHYGISYPLELCPELHILIVSTQL